jgi:type II secretory pathway pseudopilin PulG
MRSGTIQGLNSTCESEVVLFLTPHSAFRIKEAGFSLVAIMAMLTIIAIVMLAAAPSVLITVKREKELETIRRGEEVADAIKQYVEAKGGQLPRSMDDLLKGIPQGTKNRMILREASAVDPLSADGKWRLIKPESQAFLNFGRRVQTYNNGVLPTSNSQYLDKYALPLVNILNTKSEDDSKAPDEGEDEIVSTEDTPFIGVSSQSKEKSVIAYYGIENHSKWIFTPLFRGSGSNQISTGARTQPNATVEDK